MKRGLLRLHRGLGLAMAVFWLVQSITGSLLVFRWELEDALLPGTAALAEPAGLGARLEAIARDGGRATAMWATSSAAMRYDIYYADAGGEARVMRVDGRGAPLRDAADAGFFAQGAVWDTMTLLHTQLLAGTAGSWIVAASGVLLFTNLAAGLRLAWPAAQGWRRQLLGRLSGKGPARILVWHRRLGLWLGMIVLPFTAAGLLLCFETGLRERFADSIPVPAVLDEESDVAPGAALAIAAALHPDAQLSAVTLPDDGSPWYRVRQRRPGDLRRNWGTSTLFVSAADGHVLGDFPSAEAPTARSLMDVVYPFHTGQAAGAAGRGFVLILGVWLTAMIVLGLRLWQSRRKGRA